MADQIPSTLRQLWQLAGADFKPSWKDTFEPVGLILCVPPRNGKYRHTPENSLAFARTGGDGVHYSLLAVDGCFTDFSPVVMTVPMADTRNVIVGSNLKEFLALGCRFGYFSLEQLVYRPERTLQRLDERRFNPDIDSLERALLRKISSHFNVTPWPEPRRRLQELETRYRHSIVLPP